MFRALFIFLLAFSFQSTAQEVIVSKEMSIRSDYAYEILGDIDDNILLYRDRGIDKFITSFDSDLQFNWEQKLRFEEKRVKVYGLCPQDSLFTVFYGMKRDGIEYMKAAHYDKNARLQDSVVVVQQKKDLVGQDFQFLNSKDKSKSLLYYVNNSEKLTVVVYDHVIDTLDWKGEYNFNGANLFLDLADVYLTNIGSIVLLLEKNHTKLGPKNQGAEVVILEKANETGYITQIDSGETNMQSIKMSVDERNKRIGFIGMYNNKKVNWSEGYAYTFIDLQNFLDFYQLNFKPFEKQLVEDIYGSDAKKKKGLNFFSLSNICLLYTSPSPRDKRQSRMPSSA